MAHVNWAGNHTYTARSVRVAASVEDAQQTVRYARRVKALGSRHCFNDIADTEDHQLSLERLAGVVELDAVNDRVTIEAGARYGDIAPWLHARGYALANLASLPHISVAGAAATATHGSGSGIGNLATAVSAMDLITAGGDIVTLSRDKDGDTFNGAVVGLGALGVVARLTLDLQPTYDVRQDVFVDLPYETLEREFDAIFDAATSVSVFMDWRGEAARMIWLKQRLDRAHDTPSAHFFGAPQANTRLNPVPDADPDACTQQMGAPGPWFDRLPHFRMGFAPSAGAEIQAEYFVPRESAGRAVAIIRALGESLSPTLIAAEVRTVAADDLWLSAGSRGPYACFHFTFARDWPAVQALLPKIEAALDPLEPLPHWGKVFAMAPQTIATRLPRLCDFRELVQAFDPAGKFRNAYLDRVVFEGG